MLRAILNKPWRQHPTRHQLYGHLPPITKTIQVRRTRHARHCWRSRDELISDVLLWTPKYGRAKAGRPARTYIQQLCEDTGCSPEDLREAMNDREKWRERVRDIRASGTTWWWWFPKVGIHPTPPQWCGTVSDLKRNCAGFNSKFSFSKIGCLTKAKDPSQPRYLPTVGKKNQVDSYLSLGQLREVKCKRLRLWFELGTPIPFPTTITVTLSTPFPKVTMKLFVQTDSYIFI